MTEYISREELIEHLDKCRLDPLFDPDMARICFAISIFVKNMKPADVQAARHGYWSECYTDSHHYSGICSVCGGGAIRKVKGKPLDYCPNCGARMDGDTE